MRRTRLELLACLLVASIAGCEDSTAAGPGAEDGKNGGAVTAASGLGKTCAGNNDCKPHGLTCYITNSNKASGICSKGCESEGDCGANTHCNPLGTNLVCTPPQLCDPCETSDNCGPDAPLCITNPTTKGGFCSRLCNVGDGKCPGGYSCKQFGNRVDEFACQPDYGACVGDGQHCSPCKTDGDCGKNASCFQSKAGAERFCAKRCAVGTNPDGCSEGFKCASYGGKGYCYKRIKIQTKNGPGEQLVPTCVAGKKGFCDACEEDWQCGSGRCVTKNEKKFCAQGGPCTKATEIEDCPYGGQATFCVPAGDSNVCAPPPAFNCHGYKACLSHPCGGDEHCDSGICKKNP